MGAMSRSSPRMFPSTPHFFKPLLPGFEHQLSIPASFFKYLKGEECSKATLRSPGGKLWPIEVNGKRFEHGWKEFAQHHDLHVGDFLVFRHEGGLVFDVMVFDPTTCEREYSPFTINEEEIEIQEQDPATVSPTRKVKKKKQATTRLEARANCSLLGHPYYVIKLTPNKLNRVHIPVKFAREHGLSAIRCKVILQDEEGSSWPAKLYSKKSDGQVYIGAGWNAFVVARGYKPGDSLMVELIEKGKRPVLKICRLKENPEVKMENMYQNAQAGPSLLDPSHIHAFELQNSQPEITEEEVAKESGSTKFKKQQQKAKAISSSLEHPCYVIKLAPYSANGSRVSIPMKFARDHGLMDRSGELILKDDKARSWPAQLYHRKSDGQVLITRGWNYFRAYHDLNPGDYLIVELIENGNKPVLRIRRLEENPEVKRDLMYQNAQAGSSSLEQPHTHATTEDIDHKYSQLKIPEEEAKESSSRKPKKNKRTMTVLDAEASSSVLQHPFFVAKVTGNAYRTKLYIPTKFARLHFQSNSCCKVILIDQNGRSWPANLWYKRSDYEVYIRNGWKAFCIANELKPGDSFIFELIEKRKRSVLKMSGFKANLKAKKNPILHKDIGVSSIRHHIFYVTLKASHMSNCSLKIGRNFARRNGLASKCSEMIIENEKGNSRLVELRPGKDGRLSVGHGWSELVKENGLKEGDVLMLEPVKRGRTPTMKFYAIKKGITKKQMPGMGSDQSQRSFLEDCEEDVKPIIQL